MEGYRDHGIDPRLLDIRNRDLVDAVASYTSGFIGSGPLDDPINNRLASTDEGIISFDSTFAPTTLQRRRDDPWTAHGLPQFGDRHATFASDHHQGGRLQQAIRYDDLPRAQSVGEVVWEAENIFGSNPQGRSGLTSLFETQPKPPTLIVAGEDNLLGSPSVEQQCPLLGDPSNIGNYCYSNNEYDPTNSSFPSDPPPSVFSTDDECFLEEASASSYNVKGSSDDVHGDPRDALQTRHQPSVADVNWDFPEHGRYDKRYLIPVDPWTRPVAVPKNLSNNYYTPGVAHSYPPARVTAGRCIAPSSNIASTESPTPPKRAVSEVNVLAIVREDGKGGALLPPSTPKKGRRTTGLSVEQATQAAKNRKEKTCSGDIPCMACREPGRASVWHQPCTRAYFLDLVELGPCNYISQRAINHWTSDNRRRVTKHVDERFSIGDLRGLLARTDASSEISVRHTNDQIYILKLDEIRQCLNSKGILNTPNSTTLRDFLTGPMKTSTMWLNCIEGSDITQGPIDRFLKWNSMPSRATYDLLYAAAEPRQLDPESEGDAMHIVLASQLARIVCRAVELTAFAWLQKDLSSHGQSQAVETKMAGSVQQLGRTLLTLRWRVSWWQIIDAESNDPEEQKHRYIERVRGICRILYVYYFIARRKLRPWSGSDLVSKNGMQSEYADADLIWETLPHDETLQGFEQWMMEGHDMIRQANVPERLLELFSAQS
ncbi:MAG: hypothetical protein Q9211_004241 [Gyalolechia sp. 1 TL-2023]